MSCAGEIRPAATVMLIRPGDQHRFEVLLTLRPREMAFLGGAYCFPGGAVTKEDYSENMIRRCHGVTTAQARALLGAHLKPAVALGHWVAGVRELFEETGVLFAIDKHGRQLDLKDQKRKQNLAQKYTALLAKQLTFQSLLESEDLLCETAKLLYFSNWQTPDVSAIRFNTRFYVAALPEDQEPLLSSREVSQSLWLTPDEALQGCKDGKLPMIVPTFASLRTLANFESVESVLKAYQQVLTDY